MHYIAGENPKTSAVILACDLESLDFGYCLHRNASKAQFPSSPTRYNFRFSRMHLNPYT